MPKKAKRRSDEIAATRVVLRTDVTGQGGSGTSLGCISKVRQNRSVYTSQQLEAAVFVSGRGISIQTAPERARPRPTDVSWWSRCKVFGFSLRVSVFGRGLFPALPSAEPRQA